MKRKRPFIIGIGGSGSNVGKTTVAEALLTHVSVNSDSAGKEKLTLKTDTKRWGAIKYTKTAIYSSIVDTPEILNRDNKDTKRLLDAGAEEVLWVKSPAEILNEVLPLAIERLSHLDVILLEGNSAIEFLKPDIVIFISGKDNSLLKKSAEKVREIADIILYHKEAGARPVGKAKKFKISLLPLSGLDEVIDYIKRFLR